LSPRCGECHTQWSFAPARFDHTRVGCSLTGVHKTLACFDCHKNGNFAGISPRCVSCHVYDAFRANGFTPEAGTSHAQETTCARCHNMNTWLGAVAGGSAVGAGLRESVCR